MESGVCSASRFVMAPPEAPLVALSKSPAPIYGCDRLAVSRAIPQTSAVSPTRRSLRREAHKAAGGHEENAIKSVVEQRLDH